MSIMKGRNVVADGIGRFKNYDVFLPLSGVLDTSIPLIGDFTTLQSGLVGDMVTNASIRNQHVFIIVNSISNSGTITVSGVSVGETTSVPVVGDNEVITLDGTNSSYQTAKKWLEITSITIGGIPTINYDFGSLGYYDGFNSKIKVVGYRADFRASGNNPDVRVRILKVRNLGGNKFDFFTIEDIGFDSTIDNGTIIDNVRTGADDRSHTFSSELLDDNQNLAFKQSDFYSYFTPEEITSDGTMNEGLYIKLEGSPEGGLSSIDSIMLTLLYEII